MPQSTLSDEQKAFRKQGVCGSEIGAVAGLNPWSSPLAVYLAKVHDREIEDSPDMKRGRFLEDGVADWWVDETKATLVRKPGTLKARSAPLVIATPDREAKLSERLAVEIKVPRWSMGWGAVGTDEVPPYILAQAHWEMAVLEVQQAEVVALLDGDLCRYPVQWNQEFFDRLRDIAERFWTDYVLRKTPPPAGANDGEVIKELLPKSTRPWLELERLSHDGQEAVAAFQRARSEFREVEAKYDSLANQVKQILGDAEGLATPWGNISWKQSKPTLATDWKAAVTEMENLSALYASTRAAITGPELHSTIQGIISKHTNQRAGARPFVVRFSEAA